MSEIMNKIQSAVLEGDDEVIDSLMKEALDAKIPAGTIVSDGLIAAMNIIGAKMASGEMFIPEVLMGADVMKQGLETLKPFLAPGDIKSLGTVVVGTVAGDLHDIGKNLVVMMLETAGFKVIDIGIDQKAEAFLKAAKENGAKIIGMAALLTTTMPAMKDAIELLVEEGMRDKIKVIIGGAPISQEFADQIGADGYAYDGPRAVELAKDFYA